MGTCSDDKTSTDKHKALTPGEQRLQDLITLLESHLLRAQVLLTSPPERGSEEVAVVRDRISAARQQMMAATSAVCSDSAVMRRAFDATDRASAIVVRLDAFMVGSVESKQARTSQRSTADDDVFAAAETRAPRGYCDLPGTPQGAAPCELDGPQRAEYRAVVRDVVLSAQIGWTAAINALKVEEKFRTKEVTFEQRLGELLFGALFNVISGAVKMGVNSAIDAAKKALTTDGWDYVGQKIEPDADAVAAVRSVANGAVKVGAPLAKEALKSGLSAADLDASARPAVPADREGFLQSLKSAPTEWSESITSRLPQLFDRDLASLVAALPPKTILNQGYFETKVSGLLERFQRQVVAVNEKVRTVRIVDAFGSVRTALVTPETAPDPRLRGDWRGTHSPTGKWTFLRWVDEDMKEMSLTRSEEAGHVPDMVWNANDPDRWDSRTYTRFLAWNAVAEGAPPTSTGGAIGGLP